MSDRRKASHDVLNMLERLRIMHDLARDHNYRDVSREELVEDLKEALEKLRSAFSELLQ